MTSAVVAQTNWFTPDTFNVTCTLHTACPVNEACRPSAQSITINHNREQGMTQFILPNGTESRGVLGVMSVDKTQTLMATASTDAQTVYRINIFPDAAMTIGVTNYIDRPEDMFLYGTCKQPES
ncbi:hypothetical protein [Amylibacter sp. IMCC11727]|uniref:hypothetical protein n=1 Tax=Amylibacter sp. IMCC11727 TaxID=3039851 RepID=UPI00244E0575|nr:hypothetical protein [Amylibacter sp. IMCC11727]WGI22788.1 hypothetical protein QBD29_05050 [Amylibacter sp. IMCC11727]